MNVDRLLILIKWSALFKEECRNSDLEKRFIIKGKYSASEEFYNYNKWGIAVLFYIIFITNRSGYASIDERK